MPKPLFVVTAPRSGSTFLVAALDSHPRIAMTNEAAWITLLRKTALLAATPAMETIDDGEGFETMGILPQRYVGDLSAAFASIVHPFVAAFYAQVRGEHGGEDAYFGDKVLSHNDLAFAVEQFPDAYYVELVRDVRDVIVSSYAFEQKQPAAWQGAPFETRCRHLDAFFTRTQELLEGRKRLLVRYEDLVSDNAETMGRVLAFLGLEVTGDVHAYLEGPARELFSSQGTSATPGSSIGRWQSEMTEEQQSMANRVLATHLERFGYSARL